MASEFEPATATTTGFRSRRNYQGTELRRLLHDAPTSCFSAEGAERGVSLQVMDVYEANEADAARPRIRIISIHSKRTVQPLQISEPLMLRLLAHYEVAPEFVPIIYSFGEDPDPAESGNSNVYVWPGAEGGKNLAYKLRYMEDNQRTTDRLDRWSRRYTGVYHHHTDGFDLFILLQSTGHSVAEDRLCDLAEATNGIGGSMDLVSAEEDRPEMAALCADPFRLHLLLAANSLPNWRWYIRSLAHKFNRMNDEAMTFQPDQPGVRFSLVRSLRNIQDKVLSAGASCSGEREVLVSLMHEVGTAGGGGDGSLSGLQSQRWQIEGFIASIEVLRSRVKNTIDLTGYTLNLHTQLETGRVYNKLTGFTEQLRDLFQLSVDNSATVTIITVVSAIYLPGSFVATLYGMNFFVFNTQSNSISIAGDFWFFVLTWIPLTVLTGALYIVARLQTKRRGSRLRRGLWGELLSLRGHERDRDQAADHDREREKLAQCNGEEKTRA